MGAARREAPEWGEFMPLIDIGESDGEDEVEIVLHVMHMIGTFVGSAHSDRLSFCTGVSVGCVVYIVFGTKRRWEVDGDGSSVSCGCDCGG